MVSISVKESRRGRLMLDLQSQRFAVGIVATAAMLLGFALLAADGGLLLSLVRPDVKASVFVSAISFALFALPLLAVRFATPVVLARRGARAVQAGAGAPASSQGSGNTMH
jgi:hypothetical protein